MTELKAVRDIFDLQVYNKSFKRWLYIDFNNKKWTSDEISKGDGLLEHLLPQEQANHGEDIKDYGSDPSFSSILNPKIQTLLPFPQTHAEDCLHSRGRGGEEDDKTEARQGQNQLDHLHFGRRLEEQEGV